MLYCVKQCIALRTSNEDITCPDNHRNFLELLKLLAKYDDVLKMQLFFLQMKNAKYTSLLVQNEMIDILANDIARKNIIDEIKEAKFFVISAEKLQATMSSSFHCVFVMLRKVQKTSLKHLFLL